jgi:DNA-binding NarL/FixJ family response regulator
MVRMGLRLCLTNYSDILVVGEAANGREAMGKIETSQPQVVLMDLIMPEMNGVEAIREIKARWPAVKVLVLTSFAEDKHVKTALEAGATGYLLKDIEPPALVAAIREAQRGDMPLHAQAARIVIESWREALSSQPAPLSAPPLLTRREAEILQQLGQGKSNQAIAGELVISEKTVKAHVSSILSELGVRSRLQAVRHARKLGLLPPLNSL